MHFIDRSTVPAPSCLSNYHHGRNTWESLSVTDRGQIRSSLETLQGKRCAYCECELADGNQHIEHFEQRSRQPQKTFDWSNLFWSCLAHDSCGTHKDSKSIKNSYNPLDIIKPDIDDPEHFFRFHSDGTITIRPELTDHEKHRASETLRVFNLDPEHGRLRARRKAAIAGYVTDACEITELIETDLEFGTEYLESELAAIIDLPFATAIKHVLSFGATA